MEIAAELVRLQEGQSGLQDQLHALDDQFDLKHQENQRRLDKIEHTLDGNGKPGLIDTVTRIDAGIAVLKWFGVVILGPLLVQLVFTIYDHLRH